MSLNHYNKFGCYIGTPVLLKSDINELRAGLEIEYNKRGNPIVIKASQITDDRVIKLILKILFNDQTSEFLNNFNANLNENIQILPPFQIMRNYFPHPWLKHGWHSDCGGELQYDYCRERLQNQSYVFGKIGIYLQLNGSLGGGIDVIEKSHRYIRYKQRFNKIRFARLKIYNKKPEFFRFFSQNLIKTLIGAKSMSPTPSAPVFFDSGILHRGTPPNIKKLGTLEGWDIENYHIPRNLGGGNKYAIYTQFGSQMAVDSYFYDRLRRKGNADEVKRWKEDISWLNDFDEANAAKALSLIPE
jgi:hypothetical protein